MNIEYLFDIVDQFQTQSQSEMSELGFIYINRIFQYMFENNIKIFLQKHPLILETISNYLLSYIKNGRTQMVRQISLFSLIKMVFLEPLAVYDSWVKMNQADFLIYQIFGLMKGMNESEGWNHFILFTVSMLKNLQQNSKVPFTMDILAKETLQVIRRMVNEAQRQENFEEEDTANSESNSLNGDELSWDEREFMLEEPVCYDSPFDDLNYATLFMEQLQKLEQDAPNLFYQFINQLS